VDVIGLIYDQNLILFFPGAVDCGGQSIISVSSDNWHRLLGADLSTLPPFK